MRSLTETYRFGLYSLLRIAATFSFDIITVKPACLMMMYGLLSLPGTPDLLLSRRREAQKRPKTDPSFGMIRGEDESDEMFSGWSEATSELPHFSFSLEAWRGFTELGPVLL